MFTDLGAAVEVGIVLAGIAAAAVWLKSKLVQQRESELEGLVETRGQRIEDLEGHVERLEERITKLEGQIDLLKGDLGEVVANKVVGKIASLIETQNH